MFYWPSSLCLYILDIRQFKIKKKEKEKMKNSQCSHILCFESPSPSSQQLVFLLVNPGETFYRILLMPLISMFHYAWSHSHVVLCFFFYSVSLFFRLFGLHLLPYLAIKNAMGQLIYLPNNKIQSTKNGNIERNVRHPPPTP